ncbi:hypothetical protein ANCDUO_11143 [Ancylostoma duodenale]|uniref:Uncharacterized protein n=1 Tax=Ancylostoma duodenale TaxID=51022 RepID=A0A0C2GNS4_9BILA|nr:hypothetical protein ANCDUO_11143 [Ancylostoma duodenale]
MLFVSLEWTESIRRLWHARGTNGKTAGARSGYPKINGSQGDQGDLSVKPTIQRQHTTGLSSWKTSRRDARLSVSLERKESIKRLCHARGTNESISGAGAVYPKVNGSQDKFVEGLPSKEITKVEYDEGLNEVVEIGSCVEIYTDVSLIPPFERIKWEYL